MNISFRHLGQLRGSFWSADGCGLSMIVPDVSYLSWEALVVTPASGSPCCSFLSSTVPGICAD